MPELVNLVVVIVSVELPVLPEVRSTVVGLKEAVGAFATTGVIEAERDAPAVSPELTITTVDVPAAPATTLPTEGMDVMVKFPVIRTLRIVECTMVPFVAVIVIEYVPASVKVVVEIVSVEVFDPPNASD